MDHIRCISRVITEDPDIICENISKTDFYDFYALLYAHQEGNHPEHDQISRELKFLANIIYEDHLHQLLDTVLARISDLNDQDTIEIISKYGEFVPSALTLDNHEEIYENYSSFLSTLDIDTKKRLVAEIGNLKHNFNFTDETWNVELVSEISRIPSGSLKSKILAIDKIYNLLHHGGFIIDYMDESKWLEDALHYRDNANPAQILSRASSRIRSLIGRSSYGDSRRSPIDQVKILSTAIRRELQKSYTRFDVYNTDNGIIIKYGGHLNEQDFDYDMEGLENDEITLTISRRFDGTDEYLTITDSSSDNPVEAILTQLPILKRKYSEIAAAIGEFAYEIWRGSSPEVAYITKLARINTNIGFKIWPNNSESLSKIAKDPRAALAYAKNVLKGRFIEAEKRIAQNPQTAIDYARFILVPLGIERWPEAEKHILKDPSKAYLYAREVLGRRWPEAERIILKNGYGSTIGSYARDFMNGRWSEAERVIKYADDAIAYANHAIGGRWPEAERIISTGKHRPRHDLKDWSGISFHQPIYYAVQVLKPEGINRWPQLEKSILKNIGKADAYGEYVTPEDLVYYITEFLGERWPAVEPYIMKDKKAGKKYTRFIKKL